MKQLFNCLPSISIGFFSSSIELNLLRTTFTMTTKLSTQIYVYMFVDV